jgi:hypothetical protein
MSFGIYNTEEDVDIACDAVAAVAAGTYRRDYRLDLERGAYTLPGADEAFERYFSFDDA